MNPQIKQKWLNALRSGEYQQGQYCLRKEDKFCCLGVLCDLYGKENNMEWEINEDSGKYMFQNKGAERLPLFVVEWAGVESYNPEICEISLSELNDTGSTFNEIADLIETHL